MRLNILLSVGNLFLKLGDKMKNYLKTTAGILLSATMVTAPHADVTMESCKDLLDRLNL